MVGLRRFVWHGDTASADRTRFVREPAELLMTTPESLEVMLVSQCVDAARLFADLRIVHPDRPPARGWKPCDCEGPLACFCAANALECPERLEEFCGAANSKVACESAAFNQEFKCGWFRIYPEGHRERPAPAGLTGRRNAQNSGLGRAALSSRLGRGSEAVCYPRAG